MGTHAHPGHLGIEEHHSLLRQQRRSSAPGPVPTAFKMEKSLGLPTLLCFAQLGACAHFRQSLGSLWAVFRSWENKAFGVCREALLPTGPCS